MKTYDFLHCDIILITVKVVMKQNSFVKLNVKS